MTSGKGLKVAALCVEQFQFQYQYIINLFVAY